MVFTCDRSLMVDPLSYFSFQPVLSEREREMFYLTTHSTHFIYGYMASDIWLRTILIVREETRCSHIGYSFRLAARVLLYAPSHRQDNTYHGLCYTSRGALAGTRNSSMGPVLSCLWNGAYKRNSRSYSETGAHAEAAGFISPYLSGSYDKLCTSEQKG